ncbi:glycerophosphoryl diester phosphodiesterase [Natrialba chahannaoensis JCM 10990]|uniref:Glycerophosphoryl diester phosphodiesterase n=2 Tax=Natrialba chahannaoensis TaxID=68911 RepID=M0AQV5_9EURY|nr:glycerophosphoryl diester phosphodiesterase [Natrialba chahannaoensis JCM 10990]
MLNRRRFIAGTGAAVAGSTIASSASAAVDRNQGQGRENASQFDDRATVIAHRGFAKTYPENTLGAFEQAVKGGSNDRAARRGADWIELDVHPTADGDIAVFHDRNIGGQTDTDGKVYDLPSDEVFSAEVLDSGETIASLEEAMEVIPDGVGVNIDIKVGSEELDWAWGATDPVHYDRPESGQTDFERPEEELEQWKWLQPMCDIAAQYDNEILLSTFWEGALWALENEIDHDFPVAFLSWYSNEEALDMADEYDIVAINPPMAAIKGTTMFDEDLYAGETDVDIVEEAHARDLPVNVYTVDTWHETEQLIDAGVDGLFLDYSEIVRWGAL